MKWAATGEERKRAKKKARKDIRTHANEQVAFIADQQAAEGIMGCLLPGFWTP